MNRTFVTEILLRNKRNQLLLLNCIPTISAKYHVLFYKNQVPTVKAKTLN